MTVRYSVEIEQETDGRWIADVIDLPGAMAYGLTRDDALAKCQALALRVLAERIERGEHEPGEIAVSFHTAA
jgi:predicted RNase H-like HicB family nuclease